MLVSFAAATSCSPDQQENESTVLITNARIIDGTGSPAFDGSVLIRDEKIAGVTKAGSGENEGSEDVSRVIDAGGDVLAPGFIDAHSRGNPFETPRFDNFLSMGVTTITLGLVGTHPGGEDAASWLDDVNARGTGPNIIHFTGHSTLREIVDAPDEGDLDAAYISAMADILSGAMNAGSFGLSLGLEFEPGSYAGRQELTALAEAVNDHGGILMAHVRSEDDDRIEASVQEVLDAGRGSGVPVHFSHLKIVYANEVERAEDILGILQEARDEGLTVTADVYPYVASFTGISIVFPEWARSEQDFETAVSERREELEEYLRARITLRNGPEATLFGSGPWTGKTLAEVADELDMPFENVLIDEIGPDGASAAYFVMNEDVMRRFLQDPHVMIGSDGGPEMRHPRGYGSFARIIRKYVREEGLLTLEEAVHKMSGLTAATLGLSDDGIVDTPRGLIREGYAADLLIFDPSKVQDRAVFEDPHRYAAGFDHVFVNGEHVIADGENDHLPGKVIRRQVQAE